MLAPLAARTLWARPDRGKAKKKARFARQNLPGALLSCRARAFRNLQNTSAFNRLAEAPGWHAVCDRSPDGVRPISARASLMET